MDIRTTAAWQEAAWDLAEPVYHEAFPEHGRKPKSIVKRMFDRRMAWLHTVCMEPGGPAAAMALTGFDRGLQACLIDYLAVREEARGRGIGAGLLGYIGGWTAREQGARGMIIEAEAEPTEENLRRIRFWERCGFQLTDEVHHYIWVPEPYRAMVLSFHPETPLPPDGKILFGAITRFHEQAYRGGMPPQPAHLR